MTQSTFFRHVKTALRLLVPTYAQWRYARAIRRGKFLDRSYYIGSNPRLPWLGKLLPERHYVLRGEALGLCPSLQFSPRAYAFLNPEVGRSGLAPLAHYIAYGQSAHHLARDLPLGQMPGGTQGLDLPRIMAADLPTANHAIVVHVFYPDLWPQMARQIAAQLFDFDLFVTITAGQPGGDALMGQIKAQFPKAKIWHIPNHGRDIFPFVHLLNSGVLQPYKAICKLHTKRSPHRTDGDAWRDALIDGILGNPHTTAKRLATFLADPKAGLWVADGHLCAGAEWWGANRHRTFALLAASNGALPDRQLKFAAGSIYWIKPALVGALSGLGLTAADFEPEMGQVDGTTAHAIERALGLLALHHGIDMVQSSALDQQSMTNNV